MQDGQSLAKQVYEERRDRGWPGLGEEVSEICREIGVQDMNEVMVPMYTIKNAIWRHKYEDVNEERATPKNLWIKKMKIFPKHKTISRISL